MGARRYGQEGALALHGKCAGQARFVSITTFWFAQLSQDTFTCSKIKIYLNCDCGHGSAPALTGGALDISPPGALRSVEGRAE